MKSYTDESINIIKDAIPEEAKCYEWPPIGNNIDLPTLPDFPLHALPSVIRNMADEISKAVKVPASLAAAEILGLVGLAIGRNVHYCFKRSLTGRANLYNADIRCQRRTEEFRGQHRAEAVSGVA